MARRPASQSSEELRAVVRGSADELREAVRWGVLAALVERDAPELPPRGYKALGGYDAAWVEQQLRKRRAWLQMMAAKLGLPLLQALRRFGGPS